MPPSELRVAVSAAKSGALRLPVVSVNCTHSWTPVFLRSWSRAAWTRASCDGVRALTSSVSWWARFVGCDAAAGPAPVTKSASARRAADAQAATAAKPAGR